MKRSLFALALVGAMLLWATSAQATLLHFTASLSASNEVPPNASTGTGFATFDLDQVAQTLHGHITFSGLSSATTASHIHCCLNSPFQTNLNVGVATVLPAFPGFPLGVTSGVDDFILDLSSASAYNPAFVTAQGSLANAEAAFISGLTSDRTYLNIHTAALPGGEVRGFVTFVPEPMTLSLIAAGLAAAGFTSRRRKSE
jgi:CHRD domain-containing protein/PEP-CTERM motif-containing protein